MSSSTIQSASANIQELYKKARESRENSYSIYSGYAVGAAIRLKSGQIFSGCNVENSSYGATVCAERVAIQKAVSEVGRLQLAEVMVVTDASPPWPPCGMCRQVIAEFAVVPASLGSRPKAEHATGTSISPQQTVEVMIYLANLDGVFRTFRFRDLFPESFDVNQLI